MTLNGAIMQLVEMRENSMMPEVFKPYFDKVIETISECEEPSAQPEIEERMSETEQNVPNDDFISRKGAIDVIEAVFPVDPMKSEYAQGIACGAALSKTYIEQLPSAQPERKKGKWLPDNNNYIEERFICSVCRRSYKVDTCMGEPMWDFCPCGADMRTSEDK